jgi:Tfp pilus assembly protein PilO
MSEPVQSNRRSLKPQLKKQVSGFMSSRRSKMFGIAEILGLSLSCMVLLLVIFSYFYFLVPARAKVDELRADRTQRQTNVSTLKEVVHTGQNTKETVNRISASLDKFESTGLQGQEQGRIALYEELNRLITKNGLRNTSGPTYTPLEPIGAKVTAGRSVSTRWQSVYPGIAVMVTLEGSYQNLRHFIQDIERTKLFVIINEIELQRATVNNAPTSATGGETTGSKTSLVSLQLNMATYFQRGVPSAEQSR